MFHSEWQSFYPYHGGRFAINGEADNIYVIENQRPQNTVASEGPAYQTEQGWYFPRDGHPVQDLTPTYDSSGGGSRHRPHVTGYTANYSNVNGLLHGYYDARTGTQLSPSIINYPHSGFEASDTPDGGQSSDNGTFIRHRDVYNNNLTINSLKSRQSRLSTPQRLPSRHESHSIHSKHSSSNIARGSDPYWFTPHTPYYQNTYHSNNAPTSTLSPPVSVVQDKGHEVLLKPSLPRQSSMKPSIQVPADDDDEDMPPFDPSLSTVREDSAITPMPHNFSQSQHQITNHEYGTESPYTNGWVASQSQTQPYNYNRTPQNQGFYNTYRQGVEDNRTQSRGYHTMAPQVMIRQPQAMLVRQAVPQAASSVSSSVAEMRTHQYNRDRLLGTVERVRHGSSRSRRPESRASLSSEQFSPQANRYMHSPLPPAYQPREYYPELVSPVYYNNNNNRSHDGKHHSPPTKPYNGGAAKEYQPPPTDGYQSGSHPYPFYTNSGLLTSTAYNPPSVPTRDSLEPSQPASTSNLTSGLGSSLSQSRRSRPSWSHSSAPTPYEYDMSCESSPAVVLPSFTTDSYIGLYSRPRRDTAGNNQASTSQNRHQDLSSVHQSKTSYDPSYLLHRYNDKQYRPSHQPKPPAPAASDSVDENYEFDPILIDTEPQDFFHIDSVNNMPETVESEETTSSQRASLYAEQQPTPYSPGADSQRFARLRHEYYDFIGRQHSAPNPPHLSVCRLQSDIL